MMKDLVQKCKDITLNPTETFQKLRDEPIGTAFVYFLAIAAVYSVLSAIAGILFTGLITAIIPADNMLFTAETSLLTGLFSIVSGFIGAIIGLFTGTLILHLFVYIIGGRKGLEQTFKAAIYSCTPLAVIGWIPIVGIIAIIWSLVLDALAVSELQEISTARAVVAVLISAVFLIFVYLIVILMILVAITTSTTIPALS